MLAVGAPLHIATGKVDLVAEYEAMKEPEKAAKFRAELGAENKPAGTVSKH